MSDSWKDVGPKIELEMRFPPGFKESDIRGVTWLGGTVWVEVNDETVDISKVRFFVDGVEVGR